MFKFKVGDEVLVTAGRDKGKKGKIEKVFVSENKVRVSNVNVFKRHRKVSRSQAAGAYDITRPITTASVAVICPKCAKPTRAGFKIDGKTKTRICKKCGASLSAK